MDVLKVDVGRGDGGLGVVLARVRRGEMVTGLRGGILSATGAGDWRVVIDGLSATGTGDWRATIEGTAGMGGGGDGGGECWYVVLVL